MNKWEAKQLDFLSRLYAQQLREEDRIAAEKTKDRYFGLMEKIRERTKKNELPKP